MRDINSIVNLKQHPINDRDYVNECHLSIKKNSLLILENFLSKNSFDIILTEAKKLEKYAFYCQQKHTILLNKKIENLNEKDPLNKLMTSNKGCVPHDLIDKKSDLNFLYNSTNFKNFIKKVLNLNNLFPYVDKLSSINLNYYLLNYFLKILVPNQNFLSSYRLFITEHFFLTLTRNHARRQFSNKTYENRTSD